MCSYCCTGGWGVRALGSFCMHRYAVSLFSSPQGSEQLNRPVLPHPLILESSQLYAFPPFWSKPTPMSKVTDHKNEVTCFVNWEWKVAKYVQVRVNYIWCKKANCARVSASSKKKKKTFWVKWNYFMWCITFKSALVQVCWSHFND